MGTGAQLLKDCKNDNVKTAFNPIFILVKVKSTLSGLPDGPMPYVGLNNPSSCHVNHVMTMDEKYC